MIYYHIIKVKFTKGNDTTIKERRNNYANR